MGKDKIHMVRQNQKVFSRASDPVWQVFMWGIHQSMEELEKIPSPPVLVNDDFKAFRKITVDNTLYCRQEMPAHFKVKEYCPMVFRDLRERFNLSPEEYGESLCGAEPEKISSSGRSGALFYITQDQRLIVKTLHKEEVDLMHRMLPSYHEYIVSTQAKTLLPQFYSMFRLTVSGKETYVVVMRNVLSVNLPITVKYDLKGSTVNRSADEEELQKDTPTLKDNDFWVGNCKLWIGPEQKAKVIEMLTADVELLQRLKFLDYSLLVGVHRYEGEKPTVDKEVDIYALESVPEDKKEIYFMAMIDVLTFYGARKQAAHTAKTMKHGPNAEISTVNPDLYARRFMEFVSKIME
eukprot:Colp12_sorted_trinity150504_noHs@15623